MRKVSLLVTAGLLMAALATPANADGPECDIYNHCYGEVEYHESSFDAVGQELWTDCLVLDPPTISDFATHEMWVVFPGNNFIEAGYIKGGPVAGGMSETHFRYFWAEWNGTTFTSHYIASAPILYYTNFSMYKTTGGYWNIYANGTLRGSTTYPYGNANVVQTGGETTEPLVYSHGKARYLQTRNASTSAWTIATWDHVGATPGVYHVNHNAYERMEQYSLQNLCDPLPGGPVGTFGARNLTMDDFKAHALEFAKTNGESKPTTIQTVSAKREAVNSTLFAGAKVDTNEDVHVVQMKGNFTAHMASRPKGTKAPTGTVMTLIYNPTTGEVMDWSLSTNTKGLSTLGKARNL